MAGKVMKIAFGKLAKDERGKVLILALILLVVGGLILTPLLGLMSTGLVAGQVYEKKTDELYAADAGVEYGIWHLQQGGDADDILEVTINGKAVMVEIEELPHDCDEMATYEITSTATSAEGSSTTVLAQVTNITVHLDELFLDHNAGNVTYPTNVYVTGAVTLSAEVHIVGNFKAGGDVEMNHGTLISGIACVGGDLSLSNEASIEAEVYVVGDLMMNQSASINSTVHVGGSVTLSGTTYINGGIIAGGDVSVSGGLEHPLVEGNICANENVDIGGHTVIIGNIYAGGTISVDSSATVTGTQCDSGECGYCEIDPCPLDAGDPEIKMWLII
jgi:cytoskeletal protein CcmA (bactofilin family)